MTTKKKKKQTPKDDLIESLMNDVQELSGQETMHGNSSSDLFSNSEYSNSESSDPSDENVDFAAQLMNEVGDSDRLENENQDAADLWQQILEPSTPTPPKSISNSQSEASGKPVGKRSSKSRSSSEEAVKSSAKEEEADGFLLDPAPPFTPPNVPDTSEEVVVLEESVAYPQGLGTFESSQDDKTMNLSEAAHAGLLSDGQATQPVAPSGKPSGKRSETNLDNDRTIAVAGFANRQPLASADVAPKVSLGSIRASQGSVYASSDATLAQSESLRLAQRRILELEKEVEKYRYENDELASAGDIIRERAENLTVRISALESEKQEAVESLRNEIMILKGNQQYKETELGKARLKIEELEGRLKTDFKKIRVRERELENRLELVKAEKSALLRAKDENILDLKRKIDHLQSELDNYRVKVLGLNKTIDVNQEQFKRTVRALRLALSNLEVKEEESVVPFKKAD